MLGNADATNAEEWRNGITEPGSLREDGDLRSQQRGKTAALLPVSVILGRLLPPNDIALHPDPGREALEALAIEGYRSARLTHHQAARLLGVTRFEFDDFLTDRNIFDHAYSLHDLERDLADLHNLRAKGLLD